MGFLDLFGSKGNKFTEANAVPEDKKLLLQTGGILIYTNQWTPQTLKTDPKTASASQVLAHFWGVESKEEAMEVIEGLLSVGGAGFAGGDQMISRQEINAKLAGYTGGNKSALSNQQAEMLDEVVDLLIGYKFEKVKLTKADLDRVINTLAWDIERAAFVARLAYNSEYLTEAETWDILKRTRELAASNFLNWRDYAISFIKGRAIVMSGSDFGDMSDVWANACLMTEPKWGIVWGWAPLK